MRKLFEAADTAARNLPWKKAGVYQSPGEEFEKLEEKAYEILYDEALRSWHPFSGRRQPIGGVAYFADRLLVELAGLPPAAATKATHRRITGSEAGPAARALCKFFGGMTVDPASNDPHRNLRRACKVFRERLNEWPGKLIPPKWAPTRDAPLAWEHRKGDPYAWRDPRFPRASKCISIQKPDGEGALVCWFRIIELPRPHPPLAILEAIGLPARP